MTFKSDSLGKTDPPARRMVYDAFALCFGAVMIPCLSKFMSLGNTVRTDIPTILLKLLSSPAVIGVRSGVAWASRIAERASDKYIATRRTATKSVAVHGSEYCGKTRGLGSTSTAVEIAWEVL